MVNATNYAKVSLNTTNYTKTSLNSTNYGGASALFLLTNADKLILTDSTLLLLTGEGSKATNYSVPDDS